MATYACSEHPRRSAHARRSRSDTAGATSGGVLPLPVSTLRASAPVLKNPLNRGRAITLTYEQFKYAWANAIDDDEAKRLYDTYHVTAPDWH